MRLGVVRRITVCLSIRRRRHIGVVSSFWRLLQTFVCRAWFFCVGNRLGWLAFGLLCEEGHGVRGSRGETGRRLLHESGPTAMVARTRVLARGAGRSEPVGARRSPGDGSTCWAGCGPWWQGGRLGCLLLARPPSPRAPQDGSCVPGGSLDIWTLRGGTAQRSGEGCGPWSKPSRAHTALPASVCLSVKQGC